MARVAGRWGAPTITGTRALVVGGRQFMIPEDADVKTVFAGRLSFAWVLLKNPRRAVLLSQVGQLVETEAEAIKRAAQWTNLGRDKDGRTRWPVE